MERRFETPKAERTDQPGPSLPIREYAGEIQETVRAQSTSVIVGPTGSGKTTQIPLIVREAVPPEAKVAVSQPRRVAARSVARYVAGQVGCRIGQEVGFQVRFEDRTTEGTRVNFMTDGILLRKLQGDPLLRDYAVVMVDEAHERSLNIDFSLGLLKRAQRLRVAAGLEPLKIIVASATLEKEKFAAYFEDSPVVEVPGRLYPIDVHYEDRLPMDYTKAAAQKVKDIVEQNKPGDILVFMPGFEEIKRTAQWIEEMGVADIAVLPLYGDMSAEDQDRIFEDMPTRKVIIATNIAETSVTVPGVRHVIDSGFIKQMEFDPQAGIEALVARAHAKSGCIQRAGRAGRVAPGECWRLYPEADFEKRPEFQTPEIKRSNLAHVVLMMKQIGIEDVKSFEFIDPPEVQILDSALDTLKTLGALDEQERLTEIGELMADLPLEPERARMVIEAQKHNCVESVCTIASFLGGRPVLTRPKDKEVEADRAHQQFKVPGSDFLTLLKVWQAYMANDFRDGWARENSLNSKVLAEVRQVRYQLLRSLRRNGVHASDIEDPEAIGKAIVAGRIGNLMEYSGRHAYRRVKDDRGGFYLHPGSTAFGREPQLFVCDEVTRTTKPFARTIQEVKPEWLREVAPQLTREELGEVRYDPAADQVVQKVAVFLKGSYRELLAEQRAVAGEKATRVFAEALAAGRIELPFVRANKETIDALNDVWRRAEGNISGMTGQFSRDSLTAWYVQRLGAIASRQALEQAVASGNVDLAVRLDDLIAPEQRAAIVARNPDTVMLSGKECRVVYSHSYTGKFTATVRTTAADVLRLEGQPTLPSGRGLTFEVVVNEHDAYAQFSGTDAAEVRDKTRQLLIKRQWDQWRLSGKAPSPQRLEKVGALGELPQLPEPMEYGRDPSTGEVLFAHPAVVVEAGYGGDTFAVKYFASRQDAEDAQTKARTAIEQALTARRQKDERGRFLTQARELLAKVEGIFGTIRYSDTERYDLSAVYWEDLATQIRSAKRTLETETQQALKLLQTVDRRLADALSHKERRDQAQAKAQQAIGEHYATCPLCGQELRKGTCANFEHRTELIDFERDEDGREIGSVVLSQLVTDEGKVVAQLRCSAGERKRYLGDIYLVTSSLDLGEGRWRGEPFEDLRFEDLGRMLTSEQAEAKQRLREEELRRREQEQAYARYVEELQYAKEQVEQGYWRRGRFARGANPKSGEEQWEITSKAKGLAIKYVLDRWSRQPTSADREYFYRIGKPLVDTHSFKLILVHLEPPFPEDKSPDPEAPPPPPAPEIPATPQAFTDSLAQLKKRWGAK